jgi:aryl-alcohol dehydrogenase-like predicted oxidoreductase
MLYKQLGRTGLIVSQLSFGAMTFTQGSARNAVFRTEGEAADAMIGRALDAGINFFDTADAYAAGDSEIMLGKALANRRHDVVIATKAGLRNGPTLTSRGLSRHHLLQSIDASLKRLGTDYVDVYIAHINDPWTPIEETLGALDEIVRSGRARYLGFSNWPAWKVSAALEIQRAHGWAPFTHGQYSYSLLDREIEHDVTPMMRHYGIGLTAWSPLSSGFLSGKYTRDNLTDPQHRLHAAIGMLRFDPEACFGAVDLLRSIGSAKGASPAQVALAWLLSRAELTSIVLGASDLEQLDENLGAVDVPLSADELTQLDAVAAITPIYPNAGRTSAQDPFVAAALARKPGDPVVEIQAPKPGEKG